MTRHPESAALAAPPDDPRVVQALEAYLADLEAGGAPDRAALLAEYADVAGPLADCLDGLDALHAAADPFAPLGPPAGRHAPVPADPCRLGDFRLIREIGRGGMGVVYEAEEVPLGRRVAVKTLPAAAGLTPADLRRFRHEARAAALLAHPNIVPVYSVGCDRGVPYFAMRLVRGRSLAELIARSRPSTRSHPGAAAPTAPAERTAAVAVAAPDEAGPDLPDCPRFAARLALQAADALQHAHAAGVVHRDVKPANLLLDHAGHLWVADFGLAYLPGASRLTQPGALVGTLLYMAPEQVDPTRGAVDHRADLYGLGATLYELLTRRPVVTAADHRVAVARILGENPVRPRRIDPRVPRDLQTIVLTLLAKEPADRYQTAAAVADDLRRFLDGKPVRASRPGPSDLVARWAVRHRRAVAAGAAAVLAVAGLQTATLFKLARERDATLAERQQARAAVDDLYTHFAERRLAHEPGLHAEEREFLRKAQAHYDRLAGIAGGPREDRLAAAVARRRVADIDARLGDLAAADAAYAAANDQLRRLAAADPTWAEAVRATAVCATDHGNLLRLLHRPEEAGRQYAAAAAGFRALDDGGSADPFDRAGLAGVENNQGLVWQQLGRPAEAEACHRAARTRFARLAAEQPDEPAWLAETAGCGHNLADVLAEGGQDDAAERAYRESTVLRRRAAEQAPGLPAHRRELTRTRTALAAALTRRGRLTDAGPLAAEAVGEWERLAVEFPAYPSYGVNLAWGLRTAAEVDVAAGRAADALRRCDRAAALLRPLADDGTPGAAAELARTRQLAGTVHLDGGRQAAAEAALREAVAAADKAGDRTPFDRQTRIQCRLALARLVREAEADRLIREVAPDEPPPGAADRIGWASARCEWGEAVRRAGRQAEAASVFRTAVAALPAGVAGDEPRAAASGGLARVAADQCRFTQAVAHQTEAVAAAERFCRRAGTTARRLAMADELVALAGLNQAVGRPDEASAHLARAAELLAGLDAAAGRTHPALAVLARAEWVAAQGHAGRGEWAAAEVVARQAGGRRAAVERLWSATGRPLWACPVTTRPAAGGWGPGGPATSQGGR